MKRLRINFWKAQRTLSMQITAQEGLPKEKTSGRVRIAYVPALLEKAVLLRGVNAKENLRVATISFSTNEDRDCYLKNAIRAITEELFAKKAARLKVGELCKLWCGKDVIDPHVGRLLAILPSRFRGRFIAENGGGGWNVWDNARPIAKRIEPTVEECGSVLTYTWKDNNEA